VLDDQTDVSRSRYTLVTNDTDEVLSQSTVKLGELLSACSRAFTRNADVFTTRVFLKSSVLSLINKHAYRYKQKYVREKLSLIFRLKEILLA